MVNKKGRQKCDIYTTQQLYMRQGGYLGLKIPAENQVDMELLKRRINRSKYFERKSLGERKK